MRNGELCSSSLNNNFTVDNSLDLVEILLLLDFKVKLSGPKSTAITTTRKFQTTLTHRMVFRCQSQS